MHPIKTPKKLIEVALPLDKINAAAARAVIFAQMVNDPGYQQGGGFKYGVNKEKAAIERERLFRIIEDLVLWENTNNEEVLERARAEIRRSWRETCELNKSHPQAAELFNPDQLSAFHDPFAGGGALPLEAQRLGLESHASDLNPVAVTINKAMIEIPPKFAGRAPVGPRLADDVQGKLTEDWSSAKGLAEDVRRYGAWMRAKAEKRIGHLYPQIEVSAEMAAQRPDLKALVGQKLTVIAWLWARTVKSPNPAFSHIDVPLVSSFILSSKAGKEAYVEPVIEGEKYRFEVRVGKPPERAKEGTKAAGRGASFHCLMSDTPISGDYIKAEGQAGRMGARLMAIVAEGVRGRIYLAPIPEHELVAAQAKPTWKPEGDVPTRLTGGTCVPYGMKRWSNLFTPRQLVALGTFSDLVAEAIEKCRTDYLRATLGVRASCPQADGTSAYREDETRAGRPRSQENSQWHYRGRLPHFEGGEIAQSITFRLHDSLPQTVLDAWREELERLPEEQAKSERRKRIEAALDSGLGQCWLRDPRIADLVEKTLLHFDGERYRLHAWVVMPNHVHVLITPMEAYSLSSILHSWKSFTAKEANRLLSRNGIFWQEEYFDRAIRDEKHFNATLEYIAYNPVQAGLCETPEDWQWGTQGVLGVRASCPQADGTSAYREDETRAGRPRSQEEVSLDEGGNGALAYAQAVGVYLALAASKATMFVNSLSRWRSGEGKTAPAFGRQAIAMVWDFADINPFAGAGGDFQGIVEGGAKALVSFSPINFSNVKQQDAQTQQLSLNKVISTDPPYYDNIGYADLSDFFYVWLRKSLKPIFPALYATVAVPKAEELVATPYRHGSKTEAETFFLKGMTAAMHNLAGQVHPAFPVTIYYAFKQSETEDEGGTNSTGWETFLEAVLNAGFILTGTWPMRTENATRMIGAASNALASSIVLVCRQRADDAPTISRREFIRELNAALPQALEEMTHGGINSPVAPVDLSQAIIGPGMAIFSQYAAVLEADGSPMSVRTALQLINRFFAEDDFEHDTQFCLAWFESQGWASGKFGEADVLARAKGASLAGLQEAGVVESGAGSFRLRRWAELPQGWSPKDDADTPVWEALHQLVRALNQDGESAVGVLLARMPAQAEPIRALAYRLYTLCERQGWAEEARAYNELVAAWSGIEQASSEAGISGTQVEMDI